MPSPRPKPHDPIQLRTEIVMMIVTERLRQINEEGFIEEADDAYVFGELAMAAAAYATPPGKRPYEAPPHIWPWNKNWWKGKPAMGTVKDIPQRIGELVKSGALILSELERLHRYQPVRHARPEGDL